MDARAPSEKSAEPSVGSAAPSEDLALVILAAGVGSRYGGLKQLEAVGPGDATLIDYTAFDAARAGFRRIVLVVRPETEEAFRRHFDSRLGSRLDLSYAPQRLDALPGGLVLPHGRGRPWGTGHAVLAAESQVRASFAVANADDFYGADALSSAGRFLTDATEGNVPTYAIVAYRLRETLSDVGSVSRAVCRSGPGGELHDIVETDGIERHGRNARYVDESGREQTLDGSTLVSMNLWAFRPAVFGQLRSRFERCMNEPHETDRWEFRLPAVMRDLLQDRTIGIRILPSDSTWCGLTHRRDKTQVVERIQTLIDAGHYPRNLWS